MTFLWGLEAPNPIFNYSSEGEDMLFPPCRSQN